MKKYISNPELGEIDFTKDFIFEFSAEINENPSLDDTDFQLVFSVGSDIIFNSFSISNILGNPYRSKDSIEYTLQKTSSDCKYLSDSIIFVNGIPYKKITSETEKDILNYYIKDGDTYVLTSKYDIYPDDPSYVRRWNDKNEKGLYVRPVKIVQNSSGSTTISFLADKENLFDTNYTKRFRISVSNIAKTITIWDYDNELKEIKTFRYPNSIEKGKVKLTLDTNMKLSDLRFSFFKA